MEEGELRLKQYDYFGGNDLVNEFSVPTATSYCYLLF